MNEAGGLPGQPVPYRDPWDFPFEERLAALTGGSGPRVVYLHEAPDATTFRYRVYNMIQVLRFSQQPVAASFFKGDELGRLSGVVDAADVLVICRYRYDAELGRVMQTANSRGVKIFFDLDDLVFDPNYVSLLVHMMEQEKDPGAWAYWYDYVQRISKTLHYCDAIITTNSYLAAMIQKYSQKSVYIIPNFLNQEQINISTAIYDAKESNRFTQNEPMYLGYFSGTPTHNKDFSLISDRLARLFARDPRLRLLVVGPLQISGDIQKYLSRIDFYPLQDFVNLQRFIGLVRVNLVPLVSNVFTNCKSELKYFEAGIAGTVTLASPTFAYAGAIRDAENGYLADVHEWEEKILLIINSGDGYPEVARRARADSGEKYAWHHQTGLLLGTLFP